MNPTPEEIATSLLGPPVKAVLKKQVTDDGITTMSAPIGTEYEVWPITTKTITWGNSNHPGVLVKRESVWARGGQSQTMGWMPLELLDIQTN